MKSSQLAKMSWKNSTRREGFVLSRLPGKFLEKGSHQRQTWKRLRQTLVPGAKIPWHDCSAANSLNRGNNIDSILSGKLQYHSVFIWLESRIISRSVVRSLNQSISLFNPELKWMTFTATKVSKCAKLNHRDEIDTTMCFFEERVDHRDKKRTAFGRIIHVSLHAFSITTFRCRIFRWKCSEKIHRLFYGWNKKSMFMNYRPNDVMQAFFNNCNLNGNH